MKLQTRYNRITILSTLLALLVAGIGYYFLIHYVLINQLDDTLKVEEVEINDYINKHNTLPEATVFKDQRIEFRQTAQPVTRRFHSLMAFHPGEHEVEPSRQLQFTVKAGGQLYIARVTKSEEATENMVWIIVLATFSLMAFLAMALLLTNRFLFRNLWKPFRSTLGSIKAFNLAEPSGIKTEPTSITEFRELNESIQLMTNKVKNDYESLKGFTDHASHEMQTPLAVIHSKLDLLIQRPELSEESMDHIQSVYTAVDKLSRLSQSLLLLARIENNQFKGMQTVQIHVIAGEKIKELGELVSARQLKIEQSLEPLTAQMNEELADILIGNLLSNAIRHSKTGGEISLTTSERVLRIRNEGETSLKMERIFDRFIKSDESEGSGLGLAIVKQICEVYGFKVLYEFKAGKHFFTVDFR